MHTLEKIMVKDFPIYVVFGNILLWGTEREVIEDTYIYHVFYYTYDDELQMIYDVIAVITRTQIRVGVLEYY